MSRPRAAARERRGCGGVEVRGGRPGFSRENTGLHRFRKPSMGREFGFGSPKWTSASQRTSKEGAFVHRGGAWTRCLPNRRAGRGGSSRGRAQPSARRLRPGRRIDPTRARAAIQPDTGARRFTTAATRRAHQVGAGRLGRARGRGGVAGRGRRAQLDPGTVGGGGPLRTVTTSVLRSRKSLAVALPAPIRSRRPDTGRKENR